ncbi:MAG: Nif3-like dinuclear metal center hexameric protein, partial [Atopostipes sp.]|nr:Nif3-like dinuclear metal center hexameric protein [Atopostipes sp.]
FAPRYLAEDWDPIGLSFGSKDQKVDKMMVALDLDANTLKEAKEKNVDFIFTHHPAIFSSLKTLNEEDTRRKEYIDLIRSEISLYSAHTNIDAAENGMNDWLAEAIGLEKPYQIMDISYEGSEEKPYGMGRVALLKKPLTMEKLIKKVKEAYSVNHLRYSNSKLNKKIEKVAVLGGSGEDFYEQALSAGADVYITGDVSYHGAQDMIRDGLAFIDPGHYIENIFVEKMTAILEEWKKEENWEIELLASNKQRDVFNFK